MLQSLVGKSTWIVIYFILLIDLHVHADVYEGQLFLELTLLKFSPFTNFHYALALRLTTKTSEYYL